MFAAHALAFLAARTDRAICRAYVFMGFLQKASVAKLRRNSPTAESFRGLARGLNANRSSPNPSICRKPISGKALRELLGHLFELMQNASRERAYIPDAECLARPRVLFSRKIVGFV